MQRAVDGSIMAHHPDCSTDCAQTEDEKKDAVCRAARFCYSSSHKPDKPTRYGNTSDDHSNPHCGRGWTQGGEYGERQHQAGYVREKQVH
jgi:hypothetical protein